MYMLFVNLLIVLCAILFIGLSNSKSAKKFLSLNFGWDNYSNTAEKPYPTLEKGELSPLKRSAKSFGFTPPRALSSSPHSKQMSLSEEEEEPFSQKSSPSEAHSLSASSYSSCEFTEIKKTYLPRLILDLTRQKEFLSFEDNFGVRLLVLHPNSNQCLIKYFSNLLKTREITKLAEFSRENNHILAQLNNTEILQKDLLLLLRAQGVATYIEEEITDIAPPTPDEEYELSLLKLGFSFRNLEELRSAYTGYSKENESEIKTTLLPLVIEKTPEEEACQAEIDAVKRNIREVNTDIASKEETLHAIREFLKTKRKIFALKSNKEATLVEEEIQRLLDSLPTLEILRHIELTSKKVQSLNQRKEKLETVTFPEALPVRMKIQTLLEKLSTLPELETLELAKKEIEFSETEMPQLDKILLSLETEITSLKLIAGEHSKTKRILDLRLEKITGHKLKLETTKIFGFVEEVFEKRIAIPTHFYRDPGIYIYENLSLENSNILLSKLTWAFRLNKFLKAAVRIATSLDDARLKKITDKPVHDMIRAPVIEEDCSDMGEYYPDMGEYYPDMGEYYPDRKGEGAGGSCLSIEPPPALHHQAYSCVTLNGSYGTGSCYKTRRRIDEKTLDHSQLNELTSPARLIPKNGIHIGD